jgi:hypothetical protein
MSLQNEAKTDRSINLTAINREKYNDAKNDNDFQIG